MRVADHPPCRPAPLNRSLLLGGTRPMCVRRRTSKSSFPNGSFLGSVSNRSSDTEQPVGRNYRSGFRTYQIAIENISSVPASDPTLIRESSRATLAIDDQRCKQRTVFATPGRPRNHRRCRQRRRYARFRCSLHQRELLVIRSRYGTAVRHNGTALSSPITSPVDRCPCGHIATLFRVGSAISTAPRASAACPALAALMLSATQSHSNHPQPPSLAESWKQLRLPCLSQPGAVLPGPGQSGRTAAFAA